MYDRAGLAKSDQQCLDSEPAFCSARTFVQQDIFWVAGTRQGMLVYTMQLACLVLLQCLSQTV